MTTDRSDSQERIRHWASPYRPNGRLGLVVNCLIRSGCRMVTSLEVPYGGWLRKGVVENTNYIATARCFARVHWELGAYVMTGVGMLCQLNLPCSGMYQVHKVGHAGNASQRLVCRSRYVKLRYTVIVSSHLHYHHASGPRKLAKRQMTSWGTSLFDLVLILFCEHA